jgi:hypothetical protein
MTQTTDSIPVFLPANQIHMEFVGGESLSRVEDVNVKDKENLVGREAV